MFLLHLKLSTTILLVAAYLWWKVTGGSAEALKVLSDQAAGMLMIPGAMSSSDSTTHSLQQVVAITTRKTDLLTS